MLLRNWHLSSIVGQVLHCGWIHLAAHLIIVICSLFAIFCHLLLHEAHLCLCEEIVVEDEEGGGRQYFLPDINL